MSDKLYERLNKLWNVRGFPLPLGGVRGGCEA